MLARDVVGGLALQRQLAVGVAADADDGAGVLVVVTPPDPAATDRRIFIGVTPKRRRCSLSHDSREHLRPVPVGQTGPRPVWRLRLTRGGGRWRSVAGRSARTTGARGYPAAASSHVLRKVLQMLIIVGQDGQHSLAVAGLPRLSLRRFRRRQPGHRPFAPCDEQGFPGWKPLNQLCQMGPGFFEGNESAWLTLLVRPFWRHAFFRRRAGRRRRPSPSYPHPIASWCGSSLRGQFLDLHLADSGIVETPAQRDTEPPRLWQFAEYMFCRLDIVDVHSDALPRPQPLV